MLSRLFAKPDPPEVEQICSATRLSKRTARRILRRFAAQRYPEIVKLLLAQSGNHLYHDPIEDLPEMAEIFESATAEADAELAGIERGIGFCHRHWQTKQRILKTKHNIDWLPPSDMNSSIRFD